MITVCWLLAAVHALVSSVKPCEAGSKANWSAAVPAAGSGLTPARSLPTSGRATPAREPSSPKGTRAPGSGDGSAGRLASSSSSSSSSWQPAPGGTEVRRSRATASTSSNHGDKKSAGVSLASGAGGVAHSAQVRRGSRATGSSTSSHGDDHEHWEVTAGRRSSLQSTSSGLLNSGPPTRPATHTAGMLQTAGFGAAAAATVKAGSSAGSIGHVGRVHLPDIAVRAAAKPK